MSKKAQNIFLFFGLAVLAIMVSQLNFSEAWQGIRHAGYWFLAVVVLWAFLYIFNTAAWYIIIKSGASYDSISRGETKQSVRTKGKDPMETTLSFWRIYKLTVSGFALNYATPGGLMGGEPYRIMSIAPVVGTERASSSVILYAMTHMFSHFWFWALSILLFILTQTVTTQLSGILIASAVFCALGLWFFIAGYRKGLANRALNIARHIPLLKRWACPFVEAHKEQLDTIDLQIAALHSQNPRTFVCAVLLELTCRIVSALEIYFIMLVILPDASYIQSILILAFTSLVANLLFFIPLQLGGREGGFLLSVTAFGVSASGAVFVALLVRLRELIWTGLGLLLIKLGEQPLPTPHGNSQ